MSKTNTLPSPRLAHQAGKSYPVPIEETFAALGKYLKTYGFGLGRVHPKADFYTGGLSFCVLAGTPLDISHDELAAAQRAFSDSCQRRGDEAEGGPHAPNLPTGPLERLWGLNYRLLALDFLFDTSPHKEGNRRNPTDIKLWMRTPPKTICIGGEGETGWSPEHETQSDQREPALLEYTPPKTPKGRVPPLESPEQEKARQRVNLIELLWCWQGWAPDFDLRQREGDGLRHQNGTYGIVDPETYGHAELTNLVLSSSAPF